MKKQGKTVTEQTREDLMENRVIALINEDPKRKASEILKLHSDRFLAEQQPTVQKIIAIKKKWEKHVQNAPEDNQVKKSSGGSIQKVSKKKELAVPAHVFKNKRTGQTFEVKDGEPFRHFTVQGSSKVFSLDDFLSMVEKHCGEVVEVDPKNTITELPISSLTTENFVIP